MRKIIWKFYFLGTMLVLPVSFVALLVVVHALHALFQC